MAIYPAFAIHNLSREKGREWSALVGSLRDLPTSDPRVMAFSFTMRKLNRQFPSEDRCHDPLCPVCALDLLEKFNGSEHDLLQLYNKNLQAVSMSISSRRVRTRETLRVAAIA